ncbi:PAS domain S-box protein [Gemmatimonadota bacterium]
MDERTTKPWGAARVGSGTDGRFVSRGAGVVSPQRRDEYRIPGAALAQAGYQPDIVLIVKQDGTILFLNRPVPGTPDGSALGGSIFEFINSEPKDAVKRVLDRVFTEGEPDSFVCHGVPPFAAGAWYHCRVAPNQRDSGVVSATVIARDITQWKRSEDEFRLEIQELQSRIGELSAANKEVAELLADQERREHEQNRFRKLMDQAGEAIFITDPETGRFIDVNETACSWLRHPRDVLLTMGVRDLDLDFPLETPDGTADHVTDTRDANRPSVYDGGSHRRGNGTSFPVEVALARRKYGDREYMLVVARDTNKRRWTEQALRASEDKYRSLFELSRDAIYCSARDGSIADVNDSAIDLFGYTRAEFLGLEATKLYKNHEDIRTFQREVKENGSVRDLPVEFLTKSGRAFSGFLAATLRIDGEGNVQGYQCVISPARDPDAPADGRSEHKSTAHLPESNTVLVAGKEQWVLDDVGTVLDRVDIEVLTARTAPAAVEILRSQDKHIGAVLLDFATDDPGFQAALSDIRKICPTCQIILFEDLNSRRKPLAGADAVVRKPLHPLALVQQVRESLSVSRHPEARSWQR